MIQVQSAAMATNTLHNALCIILNLFKNLRLRITIARSASSCIFSRPGHSLSSSAFSSLVFNSCFASFPSEVIIAYSSTHGRKSRE